jgi:hypothetical protein
MPEEFLDCQEALLRTSGERRLGRLVGWLVASWCVSIVLAGVLLVVVFGQ